MSLKKTTYSAILEVATQKGLVRSNFEEVKADDLTRKVIEKFFYILDFHAEVEVYQRKGLQFVEVEPELSLDFAGSKKHFLEKSKFEINTLSQEYFTKNLRQLLKSIYVETEEYIDGFIKETSSIWLSIEIKE